jgi:thiol-disulfide isomerase/thioredoxin
MIYAMRLILQLVVLFTVVLCSNAQDQSTRQVPEIGKLLPDFTLNNIHHYKTTSASRDDFKGKWLFLDFWFAGCSSCIQSMPAMNKIQEQFSNDLVYVLVGMNEKRRFRGEKIERVYETMRKKMNLTFASAYDSILNERWGIFAMPHIIIVDPQGIVRHITNGIDLTAEKVRSLIDGKLVSFQRTDGEPPPYDPATFTGSEGDKLLYRCIVTRCNGEASTETPLSNYVNWPTAYRKLGIVSTHTSLRLLYQYAFHGTTNWVPTMGKDSILCHPAIILELEQDTLFKRGDNSTDCNDFFSLNLSVNPSRSNDLDYIKSILQKELENVFGFEASLEKRVMPVWNLVSVDKSAARLKTKGDKTSISDGTGSTAWPAGFKAVNISTQQLLNAIVYYIDYGRPPFFDETHIDSNIDIVIDADMTNIEEIRKSLRKNGLDFAKAERKFWVVVVKDQKPD